MQILQAQPSSATMRQAAMNDALGQVVDGFKDFDKQAKTKRAEALAIQEHTQKLRAQGYDVNEDMVKKSLEPEQSGLGRFFAITPIGQAVGMEAQGERPDLYKNRTKEWEVSQKSAAEDKSRKARLEESQINKNNRLQSSQDANLALNPDGTPMTWEQKKKRELELTSMSKKEEDARKKADPAYRLENLGAEGKSKVGAIASGLQAIDQMGKAFNAGQTMDWVDSNTPLVGNLISDTDVTSSERTMSEVVGRLQSGGAIGVPEAKTFKEMGPRRGDSKEEKIKKLASQRDFLNNKLAGFQMKADELPGLGFKTTYDAPIKPGDNMGSTAHAGGNSGPAVTKQQLKGISREEKIMKAKQLMGGQRGSW